MQVYSLAQNYNNKKLKQSTPSNSALYNSILPLTEAIFISLQSIFYIILPSITRTPDNSNFLFPLKVRIIGSRLYLINLCPILAPTVKRQQQQQQTKQKPTPRQKKEKQQRKTRKRQLRIRTYLRSRMTSSMTTTFRSTFAVVNTLLCASCGLLLVPSL